MTGVKFVASWSGGKDSALAVHRAVKAGNIPAMFWTMFDKEQNQSKSHALPLEIIQAQAKQLGVPLMIRKADWAGYETQFLDAMRVCKAHGIPQAVFGDIDLEDHLSWVQSMCAKAGIDAVHPLWEEPRRKLLEEFIREGFEAYIVVVNTKLMPAEFLGRRFTIELMDELEALGIDSCGESGEFHTVVVDGPIFKERIPLKMGETVEKDGYVFSMCKLDEKLPQAE
ncbi:ANH superfamily adenosine nucleotide alpha hydrolase [Sporosarcina newyorkensis 2681]|uniref:ANH superfamily adenosine nucleotide alpha hydrolase n=1 Tax=Sporosarcina newyorkensis 2681 TaxID=1027292 RepID=F9DRY9_9BACL|nr:diphthine--ammonia ligase [Sporosarcina newyorkensis]EGQ26418.1 ANH superfamily adenosine nucleotide alpha hydrolase [Sporosarcina newyorkensis 2681]